MNRPLFACKWKNRQKEQHKQHEHYYILLYTIETSHDVFIHAFHLLILFDSTRSFQATEAKFLRVSVSSFYDYLAVALKVYQEFDHTTTTSSTTAL